MKLLLFLGLIALASGESDPSLEARGNLIRSIDVSHNVTVQAIDDFFGNNVPINNETRKAFEEWKSKWAADNQKIEQTVEKKLKNRKAREVSGRVAAFIKRLALRLPFLEEHAMVGAWVELRHEYMVIKDAATPFEREIVKRINEEMKSLVDREWEQETPVEETKEPTSTPFETLLGIEMQQHFEELRREQEEMKKRVTEQPL